MSDWDNAVQKALSGEQEEDDGHQHASIVDTQIRIMISMRGHLNAMLQLLEDVAEAIRTEDQKELKRLQMDAYAMLAEAQLHGINHKEYPSMPKRGDKITSGMIEKIVGKQRFRVAARESNRLK